MGLTPLLQMRWLSWPLFLMISIHLKSVLAKHVNWNFTDLTPKTLHSQEVFAESRGAQ